MFFNFNLGHTKKMSTNLSDEDSITKREVLLYVAFYFMIKLIYFSKMNYYSILLCVNYFVWLKLPENVNYQYHHTFLK